MVHNAQVLLMLASIGYGYAFSIPQYDSIFGRQTATPSADPEDFSWVTKYAAIGDSYAAGIGAGDRLTGLGAFACSRYDNSYPSFINQDERLGEGTRAFEYLACSGATTPQVVKNQVSALKDGYDLVTVSTGGNDVGLSDLLNACIYQWLPGNDATCDRQITTTETKIKDELPTNLDNLYKDLLPKVATGRKVYHTGYARFFDDSTTNCDQITWSFWYNSINKQYLTQARRTKLNELAVAVNTAIKDAATRAGDQVVFVDYDEFFGLVQGRYCDVNHREPAANRDGLLFFEWDTENDVAVTLPKRDLEDRAITNETAVADLEPGTFEHQIATWINKTQVENATLIPHKPDRTGEGPSDQRGRVLSFIPDSIARVFHPRPGGHAIIANMVLYMMAEVQAAEAQRQWGPALVEAATACVVKPPSSSSTIVVTEEPTASSSTIVITEQPTASSTLVVLESVATDGAGTGQAKVKRYGGLLQERSF